MKTEINWRKYPEQKPGILQDGLITHVLTHADEKRPWPGLATWDHEAQAFTTDRGPIASQGAISHFAIQSDIVTTDASPSVIEGALPGLPEGEMLAVIEAMNFFMTPSKAEHFAPSEWHGLRLCAEVERLRATLAASSPKGWEPMESLGEIRKTERGFERISFRDRNGERCDLQQSSAAEYTLPGSSAVWLGTAGNRMHLGVGAVKALIGHLSSWLDKNTFGPASPGEAQTNKEAL